MKSFGKICTAFVVGLLLQGGVYYYLDQVYLATTTDFAVSNASQEKDGNFPDVTSSGYLTVIWQSWDYTADLRMPLC